MAIIELPTLWMFDLSIGARTQSPNTWKAYAGALVDFLRTCEANGWESLSIVDGHLATYRNHLAASTSIRGRPLSRRTVNHRLSAILEFYRWLRKRGIRLSLTALGDPGSSRAAGWQGAVKERNDLFLPCGPPRKPVAIALPVLQSICRHLSDRDNLLVFWALATGAREHELLALDLNQIPNPQSRKFFNDKLVDVPIYVTKGSKPRDLLVPRVLVEHTYRYILGERAEIAKKTRSNGTLRASDPSTAVFLSRVGRRLSARSIQDIFRRAADAEGSSAVFHDLRHTFALHRLVQLRMRPVSDDFGQIVDPLLTLRDILGHRHVSTTMLYLAALETNPHVAEEAMINWYQQWTAA